MLKDGVTLFSVFSSYALILRSSVERSICRIVGRLALVPVGVLQRLAGCAASRSLPATPARRRPPPRRPPARRISSDDSQMSPASSIGPVPSATARSTTLRSSRTLPGQWYSSIFSSAAGVKPRILRPVSRTKRLQEVLGQQRHVVAPLAQRRHADLDHLQAEEQVAAERALAAPPSPAAGWSRPPRARRPGSACCRRRARTDAPPARAATSPACRRSSRRSRRGRSCRGRPPRTCRSSSRSRR